MKRSTLAFMVILSTLSAAAAVACDEQGDDSVSHRVDYLKPRPAGCPPPPPCACEDTDTGSTSTGAETTSSG